MSEQPVTEGVSEEAFAALVAEVERLQAVVRDFQRQVEQAADQAIQPVLASLALSERASGDFTIH